MASSLIVLLGLSSFCGVVAAEAVVKLPISKQTRIKPANANGQFSIKRPYSASLHDLDFDTYYVINLTIGTPPQSIALDIDTGSSDIWIYQPGVCVEYNDLYLEAALGPCVGGSYDPDKSSTSKLLSDEEAFEITYADGTTANGAYVTDVLNVNGAQVSNMTVASVEHGESNVGIMGLGFRANEAGTQRGRWPTYQTFMDLLKSQDVIKSKAFSMYLNDKDASTGSVLFGGVDMDKFHPPMISLPIIPDYSNYSYGNKLSYTVSLSGIGVSSSQDGDWILSTRGQLPAPVLLDSGTSLTYIPSDMFLTLSNYFDTTSPEGSYSSGVQLVSCDLRDTDGTLHFLFGGDNSTSIAIPFSELALPYGYSGAQLQFEDGSPACIFGLASNDDFITILGDTFLRSAYVVYDLDNLQIGLAQTKFNSTTENIVELSADHTTLPQVSTTASVLPATSVYFDIESYYSEASAYRSSRHATPTPSYTDEYGYYSSGYYYGYTRATTSGDSYYYYGTAAATPATHQHDIISTTYSYSTSSMNAGPAPTGTLYQEPYLSAGAITTRLPRAQIDLAETGGRRPTSTSNGAGTQITPVAAVAAGLLVGALAML